MGSVCQDCALVILMEKYLCNIPFIFCVCVWPWGRELIMVN
jgi:hypothetical protein